LLQAEFGGPMKANLLAELSDAISFYCHPQIREGPVSGHLLFASYSSPLILANVRGELFLSNVFD
jgi:hypothetical protein